jgi:NMD protein affecting ribosome stability and mRNA decay
MSKQVNCTCSKCGKGFDILAKGVVGAVYVVGPQKDSAMPNVRHFNFCKKCSKILGLDKYSKK